MWQAVRETEYGRKTPTKTHPRRAREEGITMTDKHNITNVIRIARGVSTNDPAIANRSRRVLVVYTSPRDVAREVFKQARAERRANNQARD
jgi:hypothetical protein